MLTIRYDTSAKCFVKPLTGVKTKHHSQTASTTACSKLNYITNSPFIVLRNEIFSPRSDLSNRGLLSSYPSRRSVNVYRYRHPLEVLLIFFLGFSVRMTRGFRFRYFFIVVFFVVIIIVYFLSLL